MTALVGVRVAVFGLGEAGSELSADLAAAGATVVGYDPAEVATPIGVVRVADPVAAVTDVELVLAITAASDGLEALLQALDAIAPETLYADLSTAAADHKVALAERAGGRGLRFVDVALMNSVPGLGLRTPSLASGPGAAAYAQLLAPTSASIEVVGDEPGLAATRKLLRSVVVKGLAALVVESMLAADAAGVVDDTWRNLSQQLAASDEAFLRRLVVGTGTHAERRLHEMEATVELLDGLGVEPLMTRGTVERLRRVVAEGVPDHQPTDRATGRSRSAGPATPALGSRPTWSARR